MARYANNGVFNVLYPTRRKMQKILQDIIKRDDLIDTGDLYDSIRINAKVPALGELEIQIVAQYYFGFLNNGTVHIPSFDLCGQFTRELDKQGITAEIYSQYTEWMTKRYPILDVARILGEKRSIVYTFHPLNGSFDVPLEFRGQL